jgi:hypothetical protein
MFTLSLYWCVHLVENILALADVSTIYSIFSLSTGYYFSINLSAFTKIFVFMAKILIKIIII